MPELPDLTVYLEALGSRIVGRKLTEIRVASPFVVRTVLPPVSSLAGKTVAGLRRIGKQIVLEFNDGCFLVIHLMIAGRFQWKEPGPVPRSKMVLATFEFPNGMLVLTEASTKKRASMHLVEGETALSAFARGGLEVMDATLEQFAEALTRENHTVKRALADPSLFSGIGNAYSDEILHAAGLSPLKLTSQLVTAEIARLWRAVRETLEAWTVRLRDQTGDKFQAKVTAFHPEMAVHGKFGKPCPVCGTPVQHIVYALNECNYCPTCQTGGKLLADRGLSRLLKKDWPRSLDEWEAHIEARRLSGRGSGGT
ncbi:MAG TPA: DNA-formamidopyrimidine glycosylase family protein [Vicinamibacterales bacterium]|nr:DNA-formamidopyrimidine glycosylase family protein [Vicinamibacterales bacterium]